jgi:hypothetical protein
VGDGSGSHRRLLHRGLDVPTSLYERLRKLVVVWAGGPCGEIFSGDGRSWALRRGFVKRGYTRKTRDCRSEAHTRFSLNRRSRIAQVEAEHEAVRCLKAHG